MRNRFIRRSDLSDGDCCHDEALCGSLACSYTKLLKETQK